MPARCSVWTDTGSATLSHSVSCLPVFAACNPVSIKPPASVMEPTWPKAAPNRSWAVSRWHKIFKVSCDEGDYIMWLYIILLYNIILHYIYIYIYIYILRNILNASFFSWFSSDVSMTFRCCDVSHRFCRWHGICIWPRSRSRQLRPTHEQSTDTGDTVICRQDHGGGVLADALNKISKQLQTFNCLQSATVCDWMCHMCQNNALLESLWNTGIPCLKHGDVKRATDICHILALLAVPSFIAVWIEMWLHALCAIAESFSFLRTKAT